MAKRISEEKKEEIARLYNSGEGLTVSEIARQTGVSYASVYGLTRAEQRGFDSLYEYQEHLAKQRGFDSLYEYQEHLAKQRGFDSRHEYQEHLAKQRGFDSLYEYEKHLAKQRGFDSRHEYEKHLAKQRGFDSLYEYEKHLAEERQQRPLNQKLRSLIPEQLEMLGKTQKCLADQLGISEGAVSRYVSGKTTPRKDLRGKLFELLNVGDQTLEELAVYLE